MKSKSKPYCPECSKQMDKMANGFWGCPDHAQIDIEEQVENRNCAIRIMVTQSEAVVLKRIRGKEFVSTYYREVLLNHARAVEPGLEI